MKVIRAKTLGFCMGVRRAVDLARSEADKGGRVYTLGPLIHNPQALEDLRSRGVVILDEKELPPDLDGAAVIIRAHGVSPQVEAALRERGGRVIDATCPRVKASQLKARSLAKAGYGLFLAGEADHAEIIGVRGYAQTGPDRGAVPGAVPLCAVVADAGEAETAAAGLRAAGQNAKTALIGQTTISEAEYQAVGGVIKKYFPDLEIVQTICAAATDRQEALRELFDKVDALIIAGGRKSANTRRLLAIAEESGKPCALAETAAGIPEDFFAFETVGLCAGASTPDSVIDEISESLNREEPGS
jgi:4-hydroxy-3-methylbut-2-enyl diphosphate reductase